MGTEGGISLDGMDSSWFNCFGNYVDGRGLA